MKWPKIARKIDYKRSHTPKKPAYFQLVRERSFATDKKAWTPRLQPLTAYKSLTFLNNIPLKVTLAIRSDLPRRFEQVFRSKSKDIFGDSSTQHGDGKIEWRTLLSATHQPIRMRVGEQLVSLRRNNWSSICAFVLIWIIHFLKKQNILKIYIPKISFQKIILRKNDFKRVWNVGCLFESNEHRWRKRLNYNQATENFLSKRKSVPRNKEIYIGCGCIVFFKF